MSKKLVDVTALIGRHFITSSGNMITVERIGPGGARFKYSNKLSESDMQEAEAWAESILGPIRLTRNVGRKTEREAYRKFLTGE